MKKYGIKPYQSYYRYRWKQRMIKRLALATCILSFVGVGTCLYYGVTWTQLTASISKTLSGENGEVVPAYFEQTMVSYDLHHEPEEVKALYLPYTHMSKLDELIEVANETEVNGLVIDVKDDYGYLTFASDNPNLAHMVKENPPIDNIEKVMDKLYQNNVYPIARIVVFKDKVMADTNPSAMVKNKDGSIFTTSKGETWLNPYDKSNWDYLLEVCQEAIDLGFKEIQFDYIRFHESMGEACDFPIEQTKTEIITEFTAYMYEHLHEEGVVVSADVFGTVIVSKVDAATVGQDYKELVKILDYICPMIYPSHYSSGYLGIENPDLDPYGIILEVLQYSNEVIKEIPREERKAKVRPWLQDFTASWIKPHQEYGDEEVRAQIDAAYDALIDEWIFWNAAGSYSTGGLLKE